MMVLETDKTKRLSVMKSEPYISSMKEHHNEDKVINKKELNKIERNLNKHSKSITKIFNIGEKHGQEKRAMRNATVHVNGQVSVLKGAKKDHKDPDEGIKMRPILDAIEGPKKTI